MKTVQNKLIKFGLFTLTISAIMGIISVVLSQNTPFITDINAWKTLVTNHAYIASNYLLIYAYIIAIPGFWAVYKMIAKTPKNMISGFIGMMLAIFGSAISLIPIGINAFVYPTLVQLGFDQLGTLQKTLFSGHTMIFFLSSGVYYFVGILLLSMNIFKEKTRTAVFAGTLLVIHALLIILPESLYINLISWVSLLLSSVLLIVIFNNSVKEVHNAA